MKAPTKPFVLCVDNVEYEASLILGKVYRIIPDPLAAKDDLVRIVDESGEDYLYHKSHSVFVYFPKAVAKKILSLEALTRLTPACTCFFAQVMPGVAAVEKPPREEHSR